MTVNDIVADMDRINYLRSQIHRGAILEESELDDIEEYLTELKVFLGAIEVKK